MHYIRLLRPPAVERGRSPQSLRIVLAITTDLGDAYLSPQEPVEISVIGAYQDGQNPVRPLNLTQNASPRWRAGMRVLKFAVPLPPQPIRTIQIRPSSRQLTALGTSDIYPAAAATAGGRQAGLIMGVYADISGEGGQDPSYVCFRSLRLVGSDASAPVNALQVEEDFGDSIARHVWDGGVVSLSLIANLCLSGSALSGGSGKPPLSKLSGILRHQRNRPLNILELGCGVGIVGIGLSRILRAAAAADDSYVLMTDLPEAEERAQANIQRYIDDAASSGEGDSIPRVDFESLDWQMGKDGTFGDKVQSQPWDLVVVSECTYNTDTLLALVRTLSALHAHSAQRSNSLFDTKIFLATKPRHSSEREAFNMMAEEGWHILERDVLPLPVLGGDAQSVEMYLLSRS